LEKNKRSFYTASDRNYSDYRNSSITANTVNFLCKLIKDQGCSISTYVTMQIQFQCRDQLLWHNAT